MSTGRLWRHITLLVSRNNSSTSSKDYGLAFIQCFALIYNAYSHNDMPMIAFIVFVYFAYFWVDHCSTAINELPPGDTSPRKKNLQVTIWILSTAIIFGFACEFAMFLSLPVSLSIFGIAIAQSLFLFYAYFIHGSQPASRPSPSKETVRDKTSDSVILVVDSV